jgi:hypothetical protein
VKNGDYILVVAPPDYPGKKYRSRYAYEHRVVFWQTHGYLPPKGHVVHHKNEDKHDNEVGNLEHKTVAQHNADHNTLNPIKVKCGWCKRTFWVKPNRYRDRMKQARKSGRLFCCRSHQVKYQMHVLKAFRKK